VRLQRHKWSLEYIDRPKRTRRYVGLSYT